VDTVDTNSEYWILHTIDDPCDDCSHWLQHIRYKAYNPHTDRTIELGSKVNTIKE